MLPSAPPLASPESDPNSGQFEIGTLCDCVSEGLLQLSGESRGEIRGMWLLWCPDQQLRLLACVLTTRVPSVQGVTGCHRPSKQGTATEKWRLTLFLLDLTFAMVVLSCSRMVQYLLQVICGVASSRRMGTQRCQQTLA